MNIPEMYNLLLAGKKLQLEFASQKDIESFRTNLHRYKRGQDVAMQDVGMADADEKQTLTCHITFLPTPAGIYSATFFFRDRVKLKDYAVKILPDTSTGSDG